MAGYMVYNPCINEYTAKGDLQMSYISDLRKLIGHRPIMAAAAVCILYDKDKGLLFEKRTDTGGSGTGIRQSCDGRDES